ncbi:MAG: LysR family transcriptional regulator [Rhodobacteraceae bacterium]|nr:LysR family transcriptional regulator [Paracoccaceae bacterium]
MDNSTALTDWSLIQSFLAVAEHGSLSAAARALQLSQPTLGRHIQTLETSLQTRLFDRHPKGLQPSEAGQRLLPVARDIAKQVNSFTLTAMGEAEKLAGTVRITASVFASHHLLPPLLARLREEEPDIQIELVPSDSTQNLLFRAADIAVRMYRPTQLEVIARHITDLELGIFAAKSYLDRAGRPEQPEELWQHDLVGYDGNELILQTIRDMGWEITRDAFAVRCDNQSAYWELVRAGCGIGFSQRGVAVSDPLVEELDLGIHIPPLPVWLAAHPKLRHTPRVARVWDLLVQGLKDQR